MPTLDWIGKDKVINHHKDVPYKVLERSIVLMRVVCTKRIFTAITWIIHRCTILKLRSRFFHNMKEKSNVYT